MLVSSMLGKGCALITSLYIYICWIFTHCTYPGEEGVETVDLLPLSHVGVVLGDALQGELLHEVDLIGLLQVLVLFTILHRNKVLQRQHGHYGIQATIYIYLYKIYIDILPMLVQLIKQILMRKITNYTNIDLNSWS